MARTKWILAGMMVAVVLAALGCKEEDELKVNTEPTEDNVCAEAAEVVCHNAFECCVGEELEDIFGVEITTTEKDCRRDVELKCKEKYATVFYSLGKSRISLKLPRIKECLVGTIAPDDNCFPYEAYNKEAAENCDSVTGDMVEGLVAVDGECEFDYECAGEAICTEAQKCKKLLGAGEDCSSDYQCLKALHCSMNDESERVCMADVAAGGACAVDSECAEGLYCNMSGLTAESLTQLVVDNSTAGTILRPGVCKAPVANGTECSADYISTDMTANYTSDRECISGNCLPGTCADGRGECETNLDCVGRCEDTNVACTEDVDCGGQGSGGYYDGSTCDADSDCLGECSLTGSSCGDASDCQSVCLYSDGSATSYTCTDNTDCTNYVGDGATCGVQTCDSGSCVASTPGSCSGATQCVGRTCAEQYDVRNYCYAGTTWFDVAGGLSAMVNDSTGDFK